MINYYADERFESFKQDIHSIWVKKLVREFAAQNRLINQHLKKDLREPNFIIDYPKDCWGSWDRVTNTVRLSYSLFENYEWAAVVQTLKHEMAHMIVSEIWKDVSDNGNDHGELFKKACLVMEVDTNRSHGSFDKAQYRIPEKEKIVNKIQKLFCLGESNHKAEAELAVIKARELMLKYNVSSLSLPENQKLFVCRPVGNVYDKVPSYVKKLSSVIGNHYFVKHIYMTHSMRGCNNGLRHKRYIEFYGEPHNVDIAEYVFHFLIMEGERQWREFTKTEEYKNRHGENDYIWAYNRKTGESYKRKRMTISKSAFLEGFVLGFSRTLSAQDEEIQKRSDSNNMLPVSIKDELLDEKYEKEYHPTTWFSRVSGSNGGGGDYGREAGSKVVIRSGINRGSRTGNVGEGRMALNA